MFILIVVGIAAFRWMIVARLVRAQLLALREKEFVEAARALGASRMRLVLRHVLPNALGPVIVAGTIDVANAIIAESTLSFLGLGFPPDIADLGSPAVRRQGQPGRRPALGLVRRRRHLSRRAQRSASSATGCAMRSTRAGSCSGAVDGELRSRTPLPRCGRGRGAQRRG